MKPTLGWAGLSRTALKRAEAQLIGDSPGVRDEVGVLTLHTAYANRFFPGTSLQQTRLRYALFVPWQIKMLIRDRAQVRASQAHRALERAEQDLARRLPDVDGEQTIGRQAVKIGRPVAIPPSQSYWVALGAWGVLCADHGGATPSRAELFTHWGSWHEGYRNKRTTDDEGHPLEASRHLFHQGLPKQPAEFDRDKPLDFSLESSEQDFLRRRLLDTKRPSDGQPSFLSALVRSVEPIPDDQKPWSESVMRHADEADQRALHRARDAAALAAVTRAVYAAAVEATLERKDCLSVGKRHRDHLTEIVDKYGAASQRLCISDLTLDDVFIGDLHPVLASIQQWLSRSSDDPLDELVLTPLTRWELCRKGSRRAKLHLSTHGREARAAWRPDKTALAGPIEYRWSVVCRFLQDLKG